MKLYKITLVTILILNLSLKINSTIKEGIKNNSNLKNDQVMLNSVRTNHFEEADIAPPGSIINRIIPNPQPRLMVNPRPVMGFSGVPGGPVSLPRPGLLPSNQWNVPFPSVRSVQLVPNGSIAMKHGLAPPVIAGPSPFLQRPQGIFPRPAILQRQQGFFPQPQVGFGQVPIQRPFGGSMMNIGGVPPTVVPILKPLLPGMGPFPQQPILPMVNEVQSFNGKNSFYDETNEDKLSGKN